MLSNFKIFSLTDDVQKQVLYMFYVLCNVVFFSNVLKIINNIKGQYADFSSHVSDFKVKSDKVLFKKKFGAT